MIDLTNDIKQILINGKYCDIVASKNNLPLTAKDLERFKADAEEFYLTSPRFHHIVDLQIAAIKKKIEEYVKEVRKNQRLLDEDRYVAIRTGGF